MAETQAAKVDRYIAEDRVSKQLELPDGGSVWRINADTGTYRLTIDDVGVEWQCTCPAALRGRQDCAHAWAVLKLMGLEPEEVEPVQVVDADAGVLELLTDTEDHTTLIGASVPATVREVDVTDAPVTWRVIETIQHSEAVPKSLRGKPEAILAAMLLGRDWKLGPFEALRQIDVIEGTLSPGAELLLRLYRRAGHTLDVHQADDQAVTITGKRSDTGETLKVSYMLEDAQQAGLITISDNQVVARSARGNPMPWELHTAEMLWARAVTRLVRRLAPDALDQNI